jgi:hypothetical protein
MTDPPLKLIRSRRYRPPAREWRRLTVSGWQHGAVPEPPDGLSERGRAAWRTWFASWVAAFWAPMDVPGLRIVARVVDRAHRSGATVTQRREAVAFMSTYGLTPKGRRKLRWLRPLTVVDDSSDG